MPSRVKKIARAWLESATHGLIELNHDWRARPLPPLALSGGAKFASLHRVPDYTFGCDSAYFVNRKGDIFFFIRPDQHPDFGKVGEKIYLAGDFNGWNEAAFNDEWLLREDTLAGDRVLVWSGKADPFYSYPHKRFKFLTERGRWLNVPASAPNAVRDDSGNLNYSIDPERTGQHLFKFDLPQPLALSKSWSVRWSAGDEEQEVPLMPGDFFYRLGSDLPMGARVGYDETVFRLFAPRAKSVQLCVCETLAEQKSPHRYDLKCVGQAGALDAGVWEVVLAQNLHSWFYWYQVDGPDDAFGLFDPSHRVLDPYAQATVGRLGPGIVLDAAWVGKADRGFKTPAWQDLVMAEAHVRDLVARAPVALSVDERRGFRGLRQWVDHPDFYLHRLGVNCVELQPVQENDAKTADEYHWGYMTNNFFAPDSGYSSDPTKASGVKELQELVAAFHRRGMAVVLDVVYNHVGEPAHLMFVDRLYYFEQDGKGQLSNWSGCGNDLRCSATMVTRLIIDSCSHLVETYGIDGFRFDLADLVSAPVLKQVEVALKQVKPDIILIAEPWSFRGHIAGELRDTGWASWNDGYRNFVRDYVRGGGTREGFEYYLKGSPWYYAKWPAQTVNYTESHDDKTWIDNITENANGNGDTPTANDRRRTHLMAATLFMSVGIPMLSSGQDFIRSKHGIHNTYQMGEVNALDYRRIYRFPSTHSYFADWIAFRRSEPGRLVRHFTRASEKFFQFYWAYDTAAAVVIYNADRSQGTTQLLFAINNTLNDVTIPLGAEVSTGGWRQLADHERFFRENAQGAVLQPVDGELFVPALGCGLWIRES
ncbi:MAG: alpha-amylase family glycosyl hydrolase [Opitutaceae bacterium]|jgi:pullulanase/glycogen debranching enzyme